MTKTSSWKKKSQSFPGPQYSVNGGQTPRGTGYSPSYSITGRPRRSVWDSMMSGGRSAPAPNCYHISDNSSAWEHKAPVYSIGAPFHSDKRRSGPAPNSYQLPPTMGSRLPNIRAAPASTLRGKGSSNKGFAYDNARTPGPAAYSAVDQAFTMKRSPGFSMKGRTKLPAIKDASPGPGYYDPGSMENVTKTSPRFSIGVRHHDSIRPLFTLADVSD
ncbi:ciliary microtubule associated protein 1A-like isoform X2 [Littorina saxatilis]|uniref:ciliary microtubule associated protein 1A-like isoform X2 n=1 Tax=Littorina saxatilis TaxID=31220 RepID=UPI0038B51678